MAHITVYIHTDHFSYDPGPEVKQEDTVSFALSGRSDTVDVTFETPSCLLQTPAPLTVSPQGMSASSLTINEWATQGAYYFEAPVEVVHAIGVEFDTMRGELDVTTDPPTPPKE